MTIGFLKRILLQTPVNAKLHVVSVSWGYLWRRFVPLEAGERASRNKSPEGNDKQVYPVSYKKM